MGLLRNLEITYNTTKEIMKLFNRLVSALLTSVVASAISIVPLVSLDTKAKAEITSEIITTARTDRFISNLVYELSETLKLANDDNSEYIQRGYAIIKIWNTVKNVEQIRNHPRTIMLHSSVIMLDLAINTLSKLPKNGNPKKITENETLLIKEYISQIKLANENLNNYVNFKHIDDMSINDYCVSSTSENVLCK